MSPIGSPIVTPRPPIVTPRAEPARERVLAVAVPLGLSREEIEAMRSAIETRIGVRAVFLRGATAIASIDIPADAPALAGRDVSLNSLKPAEPELFGAVIEVELDDADGGGRGEWLGVRRWPAHSGHGRPWLLRKRDGDTRSEHHRFWHEIPDDVRVVFAGVGADQ